MLEKQIPVLINDQRVTVLSEPILKQKATNLVAEYGHQKQKP